MVRCTASASTPGPWTTGCSTRAEQLLGEPYSYRDSRTDGVAAQVLQKIDAAELYAVTGVQQLPFNTIYQLVAAAGTPELEKAATLLLLPDLLGYWLTGEVGAERTNASTTGLYDVRSRSWATELADLVGVPVRDPAAAALARATSSGRCCPTWPPSSG